VIKKKNTHDKVGQIIYIFILLLTCPLGACPLANFEFFHSFKI